MDFGSLVEGFFMFFTSLFRDLFLDVFFEVISHFSDFIFLGRLSATRILLGKTYGFRTFTFFEKYVFYKKVVRKPSNFRIIFASNFHQFS